MLGYEAIRCNTCNQETDANRQDSHCLRTDRALNTQSPLPDLCHHALYEIFLNGQYVESVGNLGGNAQRALEFWKRRNRKKTVTIKVSPCRLSGCTWGLQ
jgi:hypothetical protein